MPWRTYVHLLRKPELGKSQTQRIQHPMTTRYLPAKNLWETRVSINGQRKSFYAKTSEQAEAKAKDELELQRDAASLISAETLAGFIALEVAPLYAGKAAKTREQADWAFGHIIDGLGHLRPAQLSVGTVRRFLTSFEKDHEYWTVKGVRKHLYRTCRLLARYGRIPFNFVEEVQVEKAPRPKVVPSASEAMSLYWLNQGEIAEPLIFFCFVLGMRRNEASALTVEHFDGKGLLHCPGTKNGNASRDLLLSPGIAKIVERYASQTKRYLAPNEDGGRLIHSTSRLADHACARAELSGFDWHSLRHAFGAIEEELGAPRSVRLALLGQSKRSVPDLYQQGRPENCQKWLGEWEKYLGLVPQMSTEVQGYGLGYVPRKGGCFVEPGGG